MSDSDGASISILIFLSREVKLIANKLQLEYDSLMKKLNDFKQTLHKGGLKATSARVAILQVLQASKKPMSAQAIAEALPHSADQATVYRTVRSLKDKGIIIPIDLRHNHAHYELANADDHHHIVCLSCGKIENVEHHNVSAMERTILQSAKHFAEIKQHTLEFYGICRACAKKRGNPLSGHFHDNSALNRF